MSAVGNLSSRWRASFGAAAPQWHWPGGPLAVLVLASAAACARTDTVDLVARFPSADRRHESTVIDIGAPEAHDHLAAGWGYSEKWGESSFIWGLGEQSSVEFYVGVPRAVTLRMRCWPGPLAGLPQQSVAVSINGTELTAIALGPDAAEYAVAVPASALRRGVNRLDLRYAYSRRFVDLDPNVPDPRPLAVAWDWLAFDGLADAPAPFTSIGWWHSAIVLPPNTEVTFYLDLPRAGVLELGDIVPVVGDGAGAFLEVEAEAAGGPPARFAAHAGAGSQHWTLPAGGPLKLTFRPGAGTSGVGVMTPQVRRPPAVPQPPCEATESPHRPGAPVIVYLIDTLRADHLGCHGYQRPVTPRIDAFAHDAVRFSRAVAQSSWTKSSVASILTGVTPRRHGANGRRAVLAAVPTMAAVLADAGYSTAGIVTNSAVAPDFGFARGFATYQLLEERPLPSERDMDVPPTALIHQGADALRRAADAWLDGHAPARFFLYLHASDPHNPYVPPPIMRERFAPGVDPRLGLTDFLERILNGQHTATAQERDAMIALYDAEIAFVDQEFGALLDDLRARGLYDDALIVLVGDHGEAFNEHDRWQHGNSLFGEDVQVPLLIKFPNQQRAGTVADFVVQHVDILPTVLDVLGVPPPTGIDGRSLLPELTCPNSAAPPIVYSYLGGDGFGIEMESLIAGKQKLIHFAAADRPQRRLELFDLADDPTEAHDLSESHPIDAAYLFSLMAPFRRGVSQPAIQPTVDPAVVERMRALGYGNGP